MHVSAPETLDWIAAPKMRRHTGCQLPDKSYSMSAPTTLHARPRDSRSTTHRNRRAWADLALLHEVADFPGSPRVRSVRPELRIRVRRPRLLLLRL
eukprot:2662584-Rhodomonas_salina.7